MDRYVNNDLAVTHKKEVSYDVDGRTTTMNFIDQTTGGPFNIRSSTIVSPSAPYGGFRHASSEVYETSIVTQAIGRTFEFFENSANRGEYARLKEHTLSDGRMFAYEYDSAGRMTKRTSAYLDDLDGKVEVFSYGRLSSTGLTLTTLDPGDFRPRTTKFSLGGNKYRKSFMESYRDASNNNEYVLITEQGDDPDASFGDPGNLTTVTRFYGPSESADQRGRIKSVVSYDGTGRKYEYLGVTTQVFKKA